MNYVVISTSGFTAPQLFETLKEATFKANLFNSVVKPEFQDYIVRQLVEVVA